MGALSLTGVPAFRQMFEPLVPGVGRAANTNRYRCTMCSNESACNLACADDIETMILREGPDTVACVFVEPVQNAGGCFTAPDDYFARVREICDRYGILMISDETICAWGRLGSMFACDRLGYVPDIITSAKGLTSGYSPLGTMIVSDRIAEPFATEGVSFLHGFTFGGHPVSCAVAMANLDVIENEHLIERVLENEAAFRSTIEKLRDLPIVGDVRGMGYFYGIELVKNAATRETFTAAEAELLLRGHLSKRLLELGLVCRADDRGDPVIQLSPPLIAGQAEFDEIERILRIALVEAIDLLKIAS
jgi:adenosylmethionine-8-amino-7-oxononanoate aminotransferase